MKNRIKIILNENYSVTMIIKLHLISIKRFNSISNTLLANNTRSYSFDYELTLEILYLMIQLLFCSISFFSFSVFRIIR